MNMQPIAKIAERNPLVGPLLWVACLQYFIVQYIVAQDWPMPYSTAENTISDLANTVCGSEPMRYVCSPLHAYMNGSFIILGLCMVLGALFLSQQVRHSRGTVIGFAGLMLSGLGTIGVGLFPENVNGLAHVVSAGLPFALGNLALIVLAFSLRLGAAQRVYTLLSGFIPLIALVFFLAKIYLGLGVGGIERIIAYPQTIWLIVFGIHMMTGNHRLEMAHG